MDTVKLIIDGAAVEAPAGIHLLKAALTHGIYVPHLCYHPDLRPVGVCRLCMMDVEGRGMVVGCMTPVAEGMVVRTDSEEIRRVRKVAAELLIVHNHWDCLTCAKDADCELQRVASYVGVDKARISRLRRAGKPRPVDDSNPFFFRDLDKCILCGICVRTCGELLEINAIDFGFRGAQTTISSFGDDPIVSSRCEGCGECVARCPVGALIPKKHEKPSREVETICPYCGVGCGVTVGVRGGELVSARGTRENPVNRGTLCVKGRFGLDFVHNPERLRRPLVRKNGELVEADWDEALDLVASKLGEIKKEHGADAVSFFASAKCTNEENYLIQKFARAVVGTNNVDHCARL
jgi:formate dehydrogenase major subunit